MSTELEVQVIQPCWIGGKPIEIKEGEAFPVVSLPRADAIYLEGIGRVRLVEAEEAKPAAKKAKGK